MNEMNRFTIDLTMGESCNFNCKYCVLGSKKSAGKLLDVDNTINFINKILDYKNGILRYGDILVISFYGGEPSLYSEGINKIIEYYLNNKNVQFLIYSNGSNSLFDINLDAILKSEQSNKMIIQISYDGIPLHDINRLKQGTPTSPEVLETLDKLVKKIKSKKSISVSIKSTIGYDQLDKIYEAYLDVESLAKKYEKYNDIDNINIFYGPTLDLHDRKKEISKKKKNDFEQSMIKIAKHIIEKEESYFSWVSELGRPGAICSMGDGLISVSAEGYVYPCHSFYNVKNHKKILSYGKMTDKNITKTILEKKAYFSQHIRFAELPEKCQKCHAGMCKRCNNMLINISEKETIEERMVDYLASQNNCWMYYTAANVLTMAIRKMQEKVMNDSIRNTSKSN